MGTFMLSTFFRTKQFVLSTVLMFSLGACKQSEFYDKSQLLDPTKSATDSGTQPGPVGNPSVDPTPVPNPNPTPVTPPVVVVVDPTPVPTPNPIPVQPKVDCSGSWGTCSQTCGGGIQLFSISTAASNGGASCQASNGAVQTCNTQSCVVTIDPPPVQPKVDCSGSWGACSKACGGGIQQFIVTTPASNGGFNCQASNGASLACNVQSCAIVLNDKKEFFTQDSLKNGDVDILWMIDNSGSMENKQQRLSDSLGLFIDKFLNKNINFKMAITTTDGTTAHNGKMVGDVAKLDAAYLKQVGKAQFMNYFQSITKVGITGSGTEQGLKTSTTFFDRYGATFLRTDANLVIVMISDEEDQSEKKVSDYLLKLQSLKSSSGMIKIYSVVTKVLPTAPGLQDSIGNRYMEISTITGGTSSEIKNDFSVTLDSIGTSIVNLVDSFALSTAPYNNAVKVFVNKVPVATGWTYDNVSHSIKFSPTAVPSEGSQIEIDYQVEASVLGVI